VVLGYIDPDYFLGGTMKLDAAAAHKVIEEQVAVPLGLTTKEGAAAVLEVTTENMVQAIADITVNQGIDPVDAVLVGGGGAAGLNSTFIARRLGCKKVVIPEIGAALSAAGALMSDLTAEYRATLFTTSDNFAQAAVNKSLQRLADKCQSFIDGAGKGSIKQTIEFGVEARYAHQVWEIEVPLRSGTFDNTADLDALVEDFHAAHEELFAFQDSESLVEMVGWSATVRCQMEAFEKRNLRQVNGSHDMPAARRVYFAGHGEVEATLHRFEAMPRGQQEKGPAIVESPFTTVVIDPGVSFEHSNNGSLVIRL
jgi:N-methylhydantoinase A